MNDFAERDAATPRWAEPAGLTLEILDQLAAALLLTAVCVYMVGNLLLLDAAVWRSSTQVVVSCVGALLVFLSLARRLGDPLWGLVLAYGLMFVLLKLPATLGQGFFWIAAGAAAVNLARTLRVERRHWPALLLMALAATVTVLGVHRAFTSFDMLARMHAGFVHQDTLHHASIAAMVKHYGVVSTGLHGLVATPYHAFAHHLVAFLSVVSGIGIVEILGVAPWVLFAPILIYAVAATSLSMPGKGRPAVAAAWGIAVLVLALAPRLLQRWGVFDTYFNSESYLVALGLLCLGLPLLLKRDLRLLDLLLSTLLAAMLAHAKATVGLIYAGLWLTRLIFLRGGNRRLDLAALLLAAMVVGASVLAAAEANTNYFSLRSFDFIASYTWLGSYIREAAGLQARGAAIPMATLGMALLAIASFFVLHFLPSWIVMGVAMRRDGWRGAFVVPVAVFSLAVVGVGILVVSTLRMPGGSAYFFTHVAFMVSLPALVAMLAPVVEKYDPATHRFLAAALLLILVANFAALHRVSAWGRPYAPAHSVLVDHLVALRTVAPVEHVLRPNQALLDANPIANCAAQPLAFPAIAERAWVGVIRTDDPNCRYGFYGYASYGITPENSVVLVDVKLLPGMVVVDVPPSPAPDHDPTLKVHSSKASR